MIPNDNPHLKCVSNLLHNLPYSLLPRTKHVRLCPLRCVRNPVLDPTSAWQHYPVVSQQSYLYLNVFDKYIGTWYSFFSYDYNYFLISLFCIILVLIYMIWCLYSILYHSILILCMIFTFYFFTYHSLGEMLMFGGEFCDGEGTTVFNELYRWNVEKGGGEW